MKARQLLSNKYVLYGVLFVAITNVLGYLAINDMDSLGLFIVLGLISSYFSKNMIVNLAVPIVGTNMVFASKKVREGLDSMGTDPEKKTAEETNRRKKKKKKPKKQEGYADRDTDDEDDEPRPRARAPRARAPRAATESEEDDVTSGGRRIDYAATMEQAYDNLQNVLGEGGMKNLTQDTGKLIEKQKKLMENLAHFEPLMNNAKKMMEGLAMSGPQIEKLTGIIGNLTGGKKK
jgi:hypothetical protein